MGVRDDKALYRDALFFLNKEFVDYGRVKFFGSATRLKAFSRGNDFDVGVFTNIPSKEMLIEKLEKVAKKWDRLFHIKLHVFYVGSFSLDIREEKEYTVHFVGTYRRFIGWGKLVILRYIQSRYRILKHTVKNVM